MAPLRSWLVIPAVGLASAAIAVVAGSVVESAIGIGVLGAALSAAIRAFAGPAASAAVAAAAGALVGIFGVVEIGMSARGIAAAAAAMFAICELARPKAPNASPLPAVGAALAAATLDPSYVVLVVVAGIQLVAHPLPRPRWVIALPIAGMIATILLGLAALFQHGVLGQLWILWTGWDGHPDAALAVIARIGDMLGPLTAFAAIAGLVACATRSRVAAFAVFGVVVATLVVDLAGGAIGTATPIVAALGGGVAIARLAAMIRWPIGQTFLGATAGFLMLVAPAYSLVARCHQI